MAGRLGRIFSSRHIFVATILWAAVASSLAYYFFMQWQITQSKYNTSIAKNNNTSTQTEFLLRFVDFYYTIRADLPNTAKKNPADYFSESLAEKIRLELKETVGHFMTNNGQQTAKVLRISKETQSRDILLHLELSQTFGTSKRKDLLVEVRAQTAQDPAQGNQKMVVTKWDQVVLEERPADLLSKTVKIGVNGSVSVRFPCDLVNMSSHGKIKQQLNPRYREVQLFSAEELSEIVRLEANCATKRFEIELANDANLESLLWIVNIEDATPVKPKPTEQELLKKNIQETLFKNK